MTPVPDDQPSEPNAAVTEVADETEMPLPSDPRTFHDSFCSGLRSEGAGEMTQKVPYAPRYATLEKRLSINRGKKGI